MEPARPRAALTSRWIGFSKTMPNQIAEGTNIRRQRRVFCQRVEDNAFHLIDLSALPWRG